MARIKDASVDEVKAAADMVAVVSGRTQLRKAGGSVRVPGGVALRTEAAAPHARVCHKDSDRLSGGRVP